MVWWRWAHVHSSLNASYNEHKRKIMKNNQHSSFTPHLWIHLCDKASLLRHASLSLDQVWTGSIKYELRTIKVWTANCELSCHSVANYQVVYYELIIINCVLYYNYCINQLPVPGPATVYKCMQDQQNSNNNSMQLSGISEGVLYCPWLVSWNAVYHCCYSMVIQSCHASHVMAYLVIGPRVL